MADFYDYLDHLSDDAILNYAYMKNMHKEDPGLFSPAVMGSRTLPSYIPATDNMLSDNEWDAWTNSMRNHREWLKDAPYAANQMWIEGTTNDPRYKALAPYRTVPDYVPTNQNVIPDKEWDIQPNNIIITQTVDNATGKPIKTVTGNGKKPVGKNGPKNPIGKSLSDHIGKGASMNMKPFNYTPTHLQYNKGYDSGYNDVAKQVAYDKAKSAINSNDSSAIIGNYYDNFGVNKSIPTPPTTNTTSQTPSDPMSNFNDTQKSYYNYLTGYHRMGHKQALNSMGITF